MTVNATSFFSTMLLPPSPEKSTIRSARSPGAKMTRSIFTGAGSNPWSVPI